MLKGNAGVNILKSTEIISAFSKQVHLLKPITKISGLKGKKKGMKKRFTSGGGTRSFRKWCKKRERAAAGDKKLQVHILTQGKHAAAQFEDMLADMQGFANNIEDATGEFTQQELAATHRLHSAQDSQRYIESFVQILCSASRD